MNRLIIGSLLLVFAVGMSNQVDAAGHIADGTYQMSNGSLTISAMVQGMPDGKYFINAEGKTAEGKFCRVGDLAEVRGNQLIVSGCSAGITVGNNAFALNDSNNCFHCDAGLSASGTYQRK